LVVVVTIPGRVTIYLSIFIAIFAAEGTMILLPLHFPLAVFEFRHGHPGFIAARCWRRRREVRIGRPKRLDRLDVQTSSRRKSSARLERAYGKSCPRSILSINAPAKISAAHELVLRSGDDPAVHPKRRGLIKACRVWRLGFKRSICLVD